ncbi:MAG TPA: NHL repeat-containing protein [Acidobacteriaceae bacterium]
MLASALLGGCGAGTARSLADNGGGSGGKSTIIAQGRVKGGQQPVSGATIQLYTVGTAGARSASRALLTSAVTTSDGSGTGGNAGNAFNTLPIGEFTITGDYSCSSATQVYITATGGNAGGGNNTALGLLAALGPCSSLTSGTFINLNELTTVAAVYALAPFMGDYTHVGATGSNPTGLVNAFNMVNTLVNFQTGLIATPSAGITLPVARLNTLANILASCVNGTSAAASVSCMSLLSATGATETIDAGLAMANHPGSSSITGLYSLVTGTPPFSPGLSAQPGDFTLSVSYTGSEMTSPGGIAIDAGGNAWVTNEGGFSVVKFPSLSSSFTTTPYSNAGLLSPRGISIDRSGNLWIANTGGNSVVKLSSAGAALSGSGFTGGSISTPVAIVNDSVGNAWVANFSGNSITELSSSGTPSGSSPITGSGALSEPTAIALDSTGRIVIANSGTGQLCLFSSAAVFQNCISDGFLFGSTGLAINSSGAIVMTGSTTGASISGAFTLAVNTGAVDTASPVLGGGLTLPLAVAYDGNSMAWFANSASISEFSGSTAVSPATGYGVLSLPVAIAVDPSGNIWTANSGDNSVTIFVGIATPVVTPIAVNVGP